MTAAYVDTSCFVTIAFGEKGSRALARRLAEFDVLIAANLLEAEFRGALLREEADPTTTFLDGITWVLPDRPLSSEIGRVLSVGYLRGADLWHVACALYLADDPAELPFLTLDERQRAVAGGLGFPT